MSMSSKRAIKAIKLDKSSFRELAAIFPAPLKSRSNKLISSVTFEKPEEQGETDKKDNVTIDKDVADHRTCTSNLPVLNRQLIKHTLKLLV